MLLLSDQVGEVRERDREALEVGVLVEEGRKGVAEVIGRLLGGANGDRGEEGAKSTEIIAQVGRGDDRGNEEEVEEEDEDDGFEQVA